ncbi:alpha/beta hydrolase [Aquisalimonas sp.]|uniref:alpha/beta hydrolase n=1 Tax=Aquisalimonas sp. TaxID=1872621 RepID=UPI0025B8655B|nr:alpha/beta hydrolase [Aquisalimonas sp.]
MTLSATGGRVAALAGALTLATSVSALDKLPDYFIDEDKLPFDSLAGTDTTTKWGVHANAGYRIEVPEDWNGRLVVYAHGFRGQVPELTVSNPPIRRHFVENGYAWAASSFTRNRYDVKAGVKDTHALTQRFNGLVGQPEKTYIMGTSMGGHIAGVSVEQYPRTYDGALPECGVMGDTALYDYFISYSLVAQALVDMDATFPNPDFQEDVRPQLEAALSDGTPWFLDLNDEGERLKAVTMNMSGGPRPGFDTAFFAWADFLFGFGHRDGTVEGVAKGNVMDTTDFFYRFEDPTTQPTQEEMELNEEVLRVTADPQTRRNRGLANVPAIRGEMEVPVLTLHTLGDLFVPFSMQQIYAERTAESGNSHLLVQRAIRDVGHCTFTPEERAQAFDDLVDWVEHGIIPSGDPITDEAAVADPDFGCRFTTQDRAGLSCP